MLFLKWRGTLKIQTALSKSCVESGETPKKDAGSRRRKRQAAGLFRQLPYHGMCSLGAVGMQHQTLCQGTTWKLLSHQSTGVQSTPHMTINIIINTASSSRALILCVGGMFLAFWDSCLSDLTVHTLLINTVNPNSSSSAPEGLKSNFLLFCQNDWRNSSQKRSRGLSLRIAIYSV